MIALNEIKRTLDSCDIIEEVFSKYTSRYLVFGTLPNPTTTERPYFRFPEIRDLQVEHLARNLLSSIEPWKTVALKQKIEIYTSGSLPHAQDVLPALYRQLANPRLLSMRAPHPFPAPPRGDFNWQALKSELTKSLSTGTFLNMELHALKSKPSGGKPKLRPLYFCRAVGGEYTTKILTCTLLCLCSLSFKRFIFLLDVKDAPSGHNEAPDNTLKCDSDVEIEDDEISGPDETVNKNKRTQAGRLAAHRITLLVGVDTVLVSLREGLPASSGTLGVGAWKT